MKKSLLIRWVLPLAAGVMLSLPWLEFPGWLLFVAFLPLLLLDDLFSEHPEHYGSFAFWGSSFLAFVVWNGLTTWWIFHATPAGAFMAVFLNAFFMSLVFWLAHLVRRTARGTAGDVAFAAFWIAFELVHYHWDIEWPWLTLGNGFAGTPRLVQWYEYTGVMGGSLWIWMVNLLLFRLLKQLVRVGGRRKLVPAGMALFLVVVVPAAASLIRYHTYREAPDPRGVLVIQPNIDPYGEAHDDAAVGEKVLTFTRLAEESLFPGVDYIVGPETVFEQNWNEAGLNGYPAFSRLRRVIPPEEKAVLVFGASTYRVYGPGEEPSATARHSSDGLVYDVYNTALMTDTSGRCQVYHKSILVSGVEKMPYRKYLKFLDRLIINLGGTSGSLGVQAEPANFITPGGDRVAPVICYESVFGGYLAEFVREGAGVILVITNDGWWKNTPGYRQHLSFARLRAVENRRPVVRAANTGISALINQRGDLVAQTPWWVETTLAGTINYNQELTYYTRHGDVIPAIAALVSVLLLLQWIVFRITGGTKNPHQPRLRKTPMNRI